MAWIDLSTAFGYGTILTSTQMQNLRDNIAAAFAKDGGAPVLTNNYVVQAMITADEVTMEKMQLGSIMLPYFMHVEETEFSHSNDTYTDYTYTGRIYIPADATSVRLAARIYVSGGTGGVRLTIGTESDTDETITDGSYTWQTAVLVDVSGISGWQDVAIATREVSGSIVVYLQGFALVWE